jgi:DNA-binding SARP family transcriptional activator
VLFGLLGAIEVSVDGTSLPLGGPRQRAVLADLALHVGRAVPTAQLIDDVWGERPPVSATHTLETYVSRIRHLLATSAEADATVTTRPAAYMLDAAPERVDVWQFRELAARGGAALEAGDASTAVTLVSPALGLWRGPALADVREAAFAPLAAQRLEEERLTALENLMAARLALGQHRELVPELEVLIAGSPYRECFHAQLMLALYRSGRQVEALAAFARARALLADELGVEPGRELRELQRAVLLQAPELEPGDAGARPGRNADRPPGSPVGPLVPDAGPPRRGRARWWWAAAAAVVGLAAAVVLPTGLATGPAHSGELGDGWVR